MDTEHVYTNNKFCFRTMIILETCRVQPEMHTRGFTSIDRCAVHTITRKNEIDIDENFFHTFEQVFYNRCLYGFEFDNGVHV